MLKAEKRKILMLKNAFFFLKNIGYLLLFYVIIRFLSYPEEFSVNQVQGIVDILFLLWCYCSLRDCIGRIRKAADEGGYELKGVYQVYICLLLVMICITYNVDEVKLLFISYGFAQIKIKEVPVLVLLVAVYRGMKVIQEALGVVFIKDIIFEINGWNIRATLAEYWNQLLESQKIYMLYEDRSKRIPRLWILRGGSCGDVADWADESLMYYSEEECISLSDEQCKEILEKRTVKDNEECSYEVVSEPLFMPWKEDHLYEMSLRMIDLSYYKEEVMEKLICKDRDRIMILPENIKAREKKYVKKVVSCKEKIEKAIAGIIK